MVSGRNPAVAKRCSSLAESPTSLIGVFEPLNDTLKEAYWC